MSNTLSICLFALALLSSPLRAADFAGAFARDATGAADIDRALARSGALAATQSDGGAIDDVD